MHNTVTSILVGSDEFILACTETVTLGIFAIKPSKGFIIFHMPS